MVNDASRGTNRTVVCLAFGGVWGADPCCCELPPRSSTQRARIHARTGGAAAAIVATTSRIAAAAALSGMRLLLERRNTGGYTKRRGETSAAVNAADSEVLSRRNSASRAAQAGQSTVCISTPV